MNNNKHFIKVEADEEQTNQGQTLSYFKRQVPSDHIRIFLDEDIGEPSYYRAIIQEIISASEGDNIEFFISSNGGSLQSTMMIIEAIRLSPANTTAVMMGPCYSGAGAIALSCDNIMVLDSATLMIHTASGGAGFQKTSDFKKYGPFHIKLVDDFIETCYDGFLTKEEIERVKDGEDYWFFSSEIMQRLENKMNKLNAEAEEEKPEVKPKPRKRKPKN